MKRKHYILGTLALLCLLGTGYYVWTLYDAHRKQVVEWNEGAKAAFEEALWMEVDKRAEIPFCYSSSGKQGVTTLKERIPDSVFVMTPDGFQLYKIDRYKYENSLVKETMGRGDLGALLEMYPLSVDTLFMHWDSLLSAREILLDNRLRYIYTDLDLQNDTAYSLKSSIRHADSLTVKYLGFRCEHELVAYTSSPHWVFFLSFIEWAWMLLPCIILCLIVIFYIPLERLFCRKFVKEKIVLKEIHVADVSIDKAKIYQLPDGSLFDSFVGTLTKDDFVHTFPPQSALLLRLFLRKEDHRLSTAEIELELWNGNGSIDKVHKSIQRLRTELKKFSSSLVIKSVNGGYELK